MTKVKTKKRVQKSGKQKTLSETIRDEFKKHEAKMREIEKTYVAREEELNLILD